MTFPEIVLYYNQKEGRTQDAPKVKNCKVEREDAPKVKNHKEERADAPKVKNHLKRTFKRFFFNEKFF